MELSNVEFTAHAFLGCAPAEMPWVCGFPGDVATAPHRVWFGRPAFPLSCIHERANNYVCISTFKAGDDGQFRRRKDQWAGLYMVLLDDVGTKVPAKEALKLAPSCTIETSPGNLQCWLLLAKPVRSAECAEALINGLIKVGASDPGAGNLTRYGRLPVGINGKAKYQDKQGKPWVQRVHCWEPTRRYTPDQIAKAYGFTLETPKPVRKSSKAATHSHDADHYIELLAWAGLYLEPLRGLPGHRVVCPWAASHTGGDTTGTAYFESNPSNNGRGGFKCMHGSCQGRTIADFDRFVLGLAHLRTQKGAA